MYKKILLLLGLTIYLFSKTVTVNITADKFFTNKAKNITEFTGNVKMTKEKDILICNKLTILTKQHTDTNETIVKEYIGIGDVSFSFTNDISTIKGKGDKVLYYPLEFKYIVIGNGYLEDTKDGKILIGDKIYLDEKTGNAQIEGNKKKPVKFTFQIQAKDTNETN
ncbi:MAG: hypothetical protein KAQ94_08875 [Arcobacteraceae bacterium]|nr:hypothetical protein [Arcobacteraceae bacterium]